MKKTRFSKLTPLRDAAFVTAVLAALGSHLAVDLDGNQRAVDDPNTPNTAPIIWGLALDMGAYEFQPPAEETCPADLTGDGVVGVADLLLMLSAWGRCP